LAISSSRRSGGCKAKHPGFSGQSCLHYLTQNQGMVTNDRDVGGYQLAEQPHPFKR